MIDIVGFLKALIAGVPKTRAPVIDLTFMPANPDKVYGPRDPSRVSLVVCHVTAVTGGFGTTSAKRTYWKAKLAAGEVPAGLASQLSQFPAEEHPRILALWERFAALPYHWIASRELGGMAVHNFLPSMRTIHAHSGNKGVGFAVDCNYDEALTPELILAGKDALRRCIQEVRQGTDGVVHVQAHRNYSNTRMNDPGPTVWKNIVEPVVSEISYAKITYELSEGTGVGIPDGWK